MSQSSLERKYRKNEGHSLVKGKADLQGETKQPEFSARKEKYQQEKIIAAFMDLKD